MKVAHLAAFLAPILKLVLCAAEVDGCIRETVSILVLSPCLEVKVFVSIALKIVLPV